MSCVFVTRVVYVDIKIRREKLTIYELHRLFTEIMSTRAKTVPLVFHETATQAPTCRWKIPISRLSRDTFAFNVSFIWFWQFKTSKYIAIIDYYRFSPPWSGVCAFETNVHAWCWQWVPLTWALSRRKGGKNETNE